MKIKTILAVIILGTVLVASSHAFGIGIQGNLSTGRNFFAPGLSLLVSPADRVNLAINWYLEGQDSTNIVGATIDVVPFIIQIVPIGQGSFNFTLGFGVYINSYFNDNQGYQLKITGGARLPIGFNIYLARDVFEIFAHIAPSWGVDFKPELRFSKDPFFPIAIGGRFWLR